MAFVNKMDRVGADYYSVVSDIQEKLGANAVPIQIPIGAEDHFKGVIDLIEMKAIIWHEDDTKGMNYETVDIPEEYQEEAEKWHEKLLEAIAESDEELMERYFDDPASIKREDFIAAIRKATIQLDMVPVMAGAAFKNKGVQRLLDAITAFMPSPLDIGGVKGINPKDESEEIVRKPNNEEPLAALAFKIATDPYVGRLAYMRVYSGKIKAGSYVYNPRTGKKERISRLYQMHSNKQNPKEEIKAGDICAAVGFKNIKTGDSLTDFNSPVILENMQFPEPVIGIAVEPKTGKDLDKLGNALAKLAEEDPTFTVNMDEDTGQTVISGMGELHLEVIIDRLKREFKVEINQGAPQVTYKEALKETIEHREVFKKQTGGRGKFADILVQISPADEDVKGLQFENKIKGGNIPREFIPSVEEGFKKAMSTGPLAGYSIDNMKVVLLDGSFHPVDSDQVAFETAAQTAFRSATPKAKPVLLEPIMKTEVVTPEEYMGDIVADLNKRRGQVEGMETKSGARVITAYVPLAEKFGYVTILRTISSGRATSSMEFSHYDEVPENIAQQIVERIKGKSELV